MADVKTAAPKTATTGNAGKPKNTSGFMINLLFVVGAIALAHIIFYVVFGNQANFLDEHKHKAKNFMGTLYTGGKIVPILISMLFVLIIFIIERALCIIKAKGKMAAGEFVRKVQYHLANKNIDAAIAECDKQSGSVGNVMKAGLLKYREMTTNTELDKEQKILSIQKEIEEATALELPMLEKNLVFLSTISSGATLLGLLGTVLGMIASFSAMNTSGAPDAAALAGGISEALLNTATGIGTSFIAIIAYNFFTTIIDGITFGIDESGFTLTQSFAAQYK
ncbi:MAG TPA: MotA/TolQ/ExbB proton channel family protein [Chitinophagaceae bacterium]|nr:MotA/TolQ/ExbB proton channel family protein [Chitinophagaceae bacterium]HTN18607.1 MotA/TolQ/ExbB proton channel family protein [Chitinophagaceae bacterium]